MVIYDTGNAAASGPETSGQLMLLPRASFGQKPAFMSSVCETSEFVTGLKNPTSQHDTSCAEPS